MQPIDDTPRANTSKLTSGMESAPPIREPGEGVVRSCPRLIAIGILLLAPLALWFASERTIAERGPAWMSANFDPCYVYLLNSLCLAEGVTPGHVDHPGTPVQVFGANCIRLLHPLTAVDNLAAVVLAHPEPDHRAIVRILTALAALSWIPAGWCFWRRSGSLLVAVAAQASPLAFHQFYFSLGLLTPELFFLILAGLLGIITSLASEDDAARGLPMAAFTGIFVGTAIMTKINFLPICAVLMFFPKSTRARAWTLGFAGMTLAAWLFFIWPELDHLFEWLFRLITHTGKYGHGPTGLIDWSQASANLRISWTSDPMHVVLAILAGVALLASSFGGDRYRPWRTPLLLLLLACSGVFVMVAKHPAAHYILPIAAASPAIVYLCLRGLQGFSGRRGRHALFVATLGLLGIIGLCGTRSLAQWSAVHRRERESQATVDRLIREHRGNRVAYLYRSSSIAFALHFGDSFARGRYAFALETLHPGFVFFSIFNGHFANMSGPISQSVLFADRTPIMLVGSAKLDDLPPFATYPFPDDWQLSCVAAPDGMYIYQLAPK